MHKDAKPEILELLRQFLGFYKIRVNNESNFSCITIPSVLKDEDPKKDAKVLITIDVLILFNS